VTISLKRSRKIYNVCCKYVYGDGAVKYPKEFDGKLVFFTTTDRIKTTGFLIEGSNKEAVVFVHGMGGSFAKEGILSGGQKLVAHGYALFSFNTRGAEIVKSFKNARGDQYYTFGTAFEKFEDSTKDIKGAINYLESRGYEKVHLIGHSTGCQKILYYAWKRRDMRVRSLIFLSPSEDYPIWKAYLGKDMDKVIEIARNMEEHGYGKSMHYFLYRRTGELWSASRFLSITDRKRIEARLFNYQGELSILSKIYLPAQFFFGTKDETLFEDISYYKKKIKQAYRGKKLKIEVINGGDHSFHGKEEVVFDKIIKFISKIK